jgi:hypothetical protein
VLFEAHQAHAVSKAHKVHRAHRAGVENKGHVVAKVLSVLVVNKVLVVV